MKLDQALTPATTGVPPPPPPTPLLDAAAASAEVPLLYPLPLDFITENTASAGRPNYLDRNCTSLSIPPAITTTPASVVAADDEVNDYDTPQQARRRWGGGVRWAPLILVRGWGVGGTREKKHRKPEIII